MLSDIWALIGTFTLKNERNFDNCQMIKNEMEYFNLKFIDSYIIINEIKVYICWWHLMSCESFTRYLMTNKPFLLIKTQESNDGFFHTNKVYRIIKKE